MWEIAIQQGEADVLKLKQQVQSCAPHSLGYCTHLFPDSPNFLSPAPPLTCFSFIFHKAVTPPRLCWFPPHAPCPTPAQRRQESLEMSGGFSSARSHHPGPGAGRGGGGASGRKLLSVGVGFLLGGRCPQMASSAQPWSLLLVARPLMTHFSHTQEGDDNTLYMGLVDHTYIIHYIYAQVNTCNIHIHVYMHTYVSV